MNRKEFLKNGIGGVCACATSCMLPAAEASAEETKKEDWRFDFVKRRYAKLWEILSARMDEPAQNQILHELGSYCSSSGDAWIEKHRGDFEGFCKAITESVSGDVATYDRERDVIVMASQERSECFCPLNSAATPQVVCNCSLGWQQHTWEKFLGKKVKVEVKEAVLRGGKRCVFEISAADPKAGRLLG